MLYAYVQDQDVRTDTVKDHLKLLSNEQQLTVAKMKQSAFQPPAIKDFLLLPEHLAMI